MTLGERSAIWRIGEPDAAVGMRHEVVRRVERLAVVRVGDDGHRAVVLPAHDAAVEMLARDLAPLKIERIAVAVVGRWRNTVTRLSSHRQRYCTFPETSLNTTYRPWFDQAGPSAHNAPVHS